MNCAPFDQRLLSCCPTLSADLAFLTQPIENQSYLNSLAALALKPAWTAHVLACYEPIFAELAARWQRSPPLEVAVAFGKVLPAVPYLADLAETFLLAPAVAREESFQSLATSYLESAAQVHKTLDTLLALYRLLCFKRSSFVALVDPNCLFPLLKHQHRPIRYLTIRILCILLSAADDAQQEMLKQHDVCEESEPILGVWEGEKTVDYGFLPLIEAERLRRLGVALDEAEDRPAIEQQRIVFHWQLSPLTVDLCGILLPRTRGPPSTTPSIITLQPTSTTSENVFSLGQALRSTQPLLVTGPAGSGKTFLVNTIAGLLNHLEDLVSIHIGDQTDAKLLLGAYTTADTPGSFEWRPGVLTTAVREGRWVLVEDIDKAPTEVLGVLLPLIERGELVIPSRGETITTAKGFRLITTMRTTASTKLDTATSNILGGRLWKQVDLRMQSDLELGVLVCGRFPAMYTVIPTAIKIYKAVQTRYQSPGFFALSKTSLGRQISPRDLFKFCARVNALFTSAAVKAGPGGVPPALWELIFAEAVSCFAGSLQTPEAFREIVNVIAEVMQIAPQRLQLFMAGEAVTYNDAGRIVTIGRACLEKRNDPVAAKRMKIFSGATSRPFATTNHTLRFLEQVGVAVSLAEPVLLVGETGCGKTTSVQYLADILRFNLTVINLSQQTESGDLLGGYKPVDVRTLIIPMKDRFEDIFEKSFSIRKNQRFVETLKKCWAKKQWSRVIMLWGQAVKMSEKLLLVNQTPDPHPEEKKRKLGEIERRELSRKWIEFSKDLANLDRQNSEFSKAFAFKFIEGSLITAARNGDWVLLDEINLAAPDTLESIAGLLKDGGNGSIILSEKGDVERIKAHPDFRIFACMNPAIDVGKRDLPPGLRSRFTELYVVSPDNNLANLMVIAKEYLGGRAVGDERVCADVSNLYLHAKQLAETHKLVDGANQRPHFSLRTLTRTLSYAVEISSIYGLRRSLYEGFCMSFLTLLDQASEALLFPIIEKYILGAQRNLKSLMSQIPQKPQDGKEYVQFKHYWMHKGQLPSEDQPSYIITPFVSRNILNLVRATATRRFPVLIQGPTSSGKTSMIQYLAKRTGHKFVRINNHEHTDLQEYIGTYVSDDDGKLKFQEGILVEALRQGHWIVLDELNLAPTDVLEALNRLLDDNRELLIPETQEVVRPHEDFMLFATQNPAGLYGGRKMLSRAFRNRFLELHFDDIPEDELETILRERCRIAPSYCHKIVAVYKELSLLRQSTRLFERKNSFATLRDLFRWANREAIGYQQLAENGYMLLAERVRKEDEKLAVKTIIEKIMRVSINDSALYALESLPDYALQKHKLDQASVIWTKAMRRLYSLVVHALKGNEPVLLVGETGCGKTTVCEVLAKVFGKKLSVVNAHQNTETGDLIGAQRPIRNRSVHRKQLVEDLKAVFESNGLVISEEELDKSWAIYTTLDKSKISREIQTRIQTNRTKTKSLFEWTDGSLVQAMKEGHFFLLDEISLADDSVLERLNSVLEPQRSIFLAEKGTEEAQISAEDGFRFLATMNPGGDYGKKELSPALRNRFTEIWVPCMSDSEDALEIVNAGLLPPPQYSTSLFPKAMIGFAQFIAETYNKGSSSSSISIRDLLTWVSFCNTLNSSATKEDFAFYFLHGAAMVYIDGLGANPSAGLTTAPEDLAKEKEKCVDKLSALVGIDLSTFYEQHHTLTIDASTINVGKFSLPRKSIMEEKDVFYSFDAHTTEMNVMRIIRAMQLKKPILMEGNPGVGKTTLIEKLAMISGKNLIRINLSEQTDLMDLFGSDIPVEGGNSGEFAWRDAPFLQAMQNGYWVLLDEMNLASQSVLEGLNACLDHRREAYVAELDKTFTCHPEFTVFAAQNPHHQGGGRKGLPASFVNRFTLVYIDMLNAEDMQTIATKLYPTVPKNDISDIVRFIMLLDEEVGRKRSFGQVGGPWEFNLRDAVRWLNLITDTPPPYFPGARREVGRSSLGDPPELWQYLGLVISQRFRTPADRKRVHQLFEQVFLKPIPQRSLYHRLSRKTFQIGHSLIRRSEIIQHTLAPGITLLKKDLGVLETLMTCVQVNMPVVLVGASGVGKSSVIKYLAAIFGGELEELAMNADVDTTDIVGGFEQVDLLRKSSELFWKVNRWARYCIVVQLKLLEPSAPNTPGISTFFKLLEYTTTTTTTKLSPPRISNIERLRQVLEALQSLEAYPDYNPPLSLKTECQSLLTTSESQDHQIAKFEWVDGTLIRAIQEGKWLILDNANLCSPSVLDRLNSLLEPGGTLVVNEHGCEDGAPRIIRPHSQFRLFLTMDPRHGELSRAMRNRSVEVFMEEEEQPSPSLSEMDRVVRGDEKERMVIARNSPILGTDSSMTLWQDMIRILNTSSLNNNNIPPSLNNEPLRITYDPSGLSDPRTDPPPASVEVYYELLKICFEHVPINKFRTGALERWVPYWTSITPLPPMRGVVDSRIRCASLWEVKNRTMRPASDVVPVIMPVNYMRNTYVFDAISIPPVTKDLILRSYEVAGKIIAMRHVEDVVLLTLENKEVADMTVLERSALVGKRVVAAKEGDGGGGDERESVAAPSFQVLMMVKCALDGWVRGFEEEEVNEPVVHSIEELVYLWQDIKRLCSNSPFNLDETIFHVYLALLDEWYQQATSVLPAQFMTSMKEALNKFRAPLKLKTGFSMEVMWNELRPSVPRSVEVWRKYGELCKVAERFDEVARVRIGELEMIIAMRRSFVDAFMALLTTNDVDTTELISGLDHAIHQLETEQKQLMQPCQGLFVSAFNRLLNFRNLQASLTSQKLDDNLLTIAHFTNRSTVSLLNYQGGGGDAKTTDFRTSYEQVLEDIWKCSGEETAAPDLLGGGFVAEVLQTEGLTKNAVIGQLGQLNVELRALAKQVVVNMSVIACDRVLQLSLVLLRKVFKIFEIHEKSYDPEAFTKIRVMFERLSYSFQSGDFVPDGNSRQLDVFTNTKDTALSEVMSEHFQPAVEALATIAAARTRFDILGYFAKAWTHYALGCLKLFVPSCVFDPAMRPVVERDRFLRRKEELRNRIKGEKIFASKFTGLFQDINGLLEKEKSMGDEPPKPYIIRAKDSKITALQGEFEMLLRVVVGTDPHVRLLPWISHSMNTSMRNTDEQLSQKNLSQFVDRLRGGYPLYRDMTDPAVGFIYSLKMGLSIAATRPEKDSRNLLWLRWPSPFEQGAPSLSIYDGEAEVKLLRLWRFTARSCIEGFEKLGRKDSIDIEGIFKRFFQNWKLQISEEQEKAAANASLYRYRGEEEDVDETELKQMFPDYENDTSGGDSKEECEETKSGSYSELAVQIARCHSALYLATDDSEASLSSLIRRGVAVMMKLESEGYDNDNDNDDGGQSSSLECGQTNLCLPAVLLSLKETTDWISGRDQTSKTYDFYLHENLEQAQKLVVIVEKARRHLVKLLEVWPEHVTLQDSMEACQQLLELPNVTPVAKFIIHVEKLHAMLNEWQGVASHQYSVAEHYDALTQLIISWRKLELTTWPRLFDAEDEKCRNEANSWWFYAYESVIANPLQLLGEGQSIKEHLGTLMSALVTFITSSSVGQFPHRLQILRAFEQHVFRLSDEFPAMDRIRMGLHNFIAYYSQYESTCRETLSKQRKKLAGQIADVILLASWKDTNIAALRDSARRSHQKLYRVVRKYRHALGQSVTLVIQVGMPEGGVIKEGVTAVNGFVEPMIDIDLTKDICEKAVDGWNNRPARLIDLPGAVATMERVSQIPAERVDVVEFVETFSSNIAATIKELQSETPGVLTDANKELVKHLKTRKRKAFTDALKELRNMGLSFNLSSAVLQKQADLEAILMEMEILNPGDDVVGIDTGGVEHYFLRLIETLPKIRQSLAEHSPDLTGPDVARSVGYLEHLLAMNLEQRLTISSSLGDLEKVQVVVGKYHTLSNLITTPLCPADNKRFTTLEKTFRWLPKTLDLVQDVLEIHCEFGNVAFEKAKEFIVNSRMTACKIEKRFSDHKHIHEDIWEDSTRALMEDSKSCLDEMKSGLNELNTETPGIEYLTSQILPLTSPPELDTPSDDDTPSNYDESEDHPSSTNELDSLLQSLCNSIFVALQKLKEAQDSYPSSPKDPGWLSKHRTITVASLKALHMRDISRRINNCIFSATRVPLVDTQTTRALFKAYFPIIKEYTNICQRTVQGVVAVHRAMCKTTYILSTSASTILFKGFCTPAEKEDGSGGETASGLEEGTGLGEGEGAEDISKDIGADEDLSELAQEKNKEKNDYEIEEEENAIDIEDEMEGELGDKEQKGDDDEEGKEDDDLEKEGMDEEVGDVDDLDPTAVDEKMWDEKGNDDDKQKEGDQKGKESAGDDMEAKKENGKEGKESEQAEGKEELQDESEEAEGADLDDEVKPQETEGADQYIPEVDTLDLPEDMELDNGEENNEEDGTDDLDDLLSDGAEEDMKMEDEKTGQEDAFPELDAPEKKTESGEETKENGEAVEDKENDQDGENDDDPMDTDEEEDTDEAEKDLLQTRDENTAKEADQTAPSEVQGVEGGGDQKDTNEQTSAQQESGEEAKSGENSQGKGTEQTQSQEQVTGQSSAQESDPANDQMSKQQDQTQQESSFRKVGDVLEKWHRQNRQILDSQKDDIEHLQLENMELNDPEFEHLPNDDAAADTQALGAATEDQAHGLDDSMAIDSGENQHQDTFEGDAPQDAVDDSMRDDDQVECGDKDKRDDAQDSHAGAMIGETGNKSSQRERAALDEMEVDDEEVPTSTIADIESESATDTLTTTRSPEEARQLWQKYEQSTKDLSMGLCEQLRLILEPTLATKMRGDFRTGKRLNMKRIIPYIASQYKKDKIWMRRTKPSKRQYQVMIAVDDSKSMAESNSVALAFQTVALVAKALSQLEVGQISILSFGETTKLVHPFNQPFTSESGVKVFENFTFNQLKTNVKTLVQTSMAIFESVRQNASADLWQLEIIISDGVCEDHESLRRLVRKAQEEKIMIVFVIVDSLRDNSILELKKVTFDPTPADGGVPGMKMERYLDTFPFNYYLVVGDVKELPGVLALALRQWLAEIVEVTG